MQSLQTPRLKLPLLAVGQAQKELFHNEAITLLDFLVCPTVLSIHDDPTSLLPSEGEAWLIDTNPSGLWDSHANQIAIWTNGGWRFVEPHLQAYVFVADRSETAVYRGGAWIFNNGINNPHGGSVVDVEARQAIDSILEALRTKAIIES